MLLKYFNSNRISILLFISLLPVVYWIPSLFPSIAPAAPESSGIPLGRWIIAFNSDYRIIASVLAMILVAVNAYLLVQLNTIHIFIPVRTQLPSFFYALIVIGMTQLHLLTPALVASTILIVLLFRLFSAYKTEGISIHFMDAGMLIALASMVYFPSLVFFLFLLAGMTILRPFVWREWVFAFLGLAIPYIFLASVYYLADLPFATYFNDIADSLKKPEQHFKLSQIVNWIYVLVFMLFSSYFMAEALNKMKIHARKFFLVSLLFFLLSVVIFLVIRGAGVGMVYFTAIPLAYLFAYYFAKCPFTWYNEIFFGLFLLLLLWQRI
jgi:hypothetical protein